MNQIKKYGKTISLHAYILIQHYILVNQDLQNEKN